MFSRRLVNIMRALFRCNAVEAELDEELRFHFDKQVEKFVQSGLPIVEARRRAWLVIGGSDLIKEECRDVRSTRVIDTFLQDLRHVCRPVVRTPLQTLLIVTTLGLAMGAVLSVFSILDKLVTRPLPIAKPNELVLVSAEQPEPRNIITATTVAGNKDVFAWSMDYPHFIYLRDQVHVLQAMSAHMPAAAKLATSGDPVRVKGYLVSGDYFNLLGIKAQLGRTLTAEDERQQDGNAAVVLTHAFWQRQFGGDPSILNRTIRLNKEPVVVIGVTPPGFNGTQPEWDADFFLSLNHTGVFLPIPGFRYDEAGNDIYTVMARLAPGVTLEQAEREAEKVHQRRLAESVPKPAANRAYRLRLYQAGYASILPSGLKRDPKSPLRLLMAMVALVLIVAAGNVANLLLARRTARARETAIRFALGSSRWRILRELLGESLLLSAAAAVLGYFLAAWTAHLVPVLLKMQDPPASIAEPGFKSHLFAVGLALMVGIGIWGASAMRATKRSLLPGLIENSAVGGAPRATQWRRGMVVLQIAFSLILLCVSFVLCRSLINLMSIDPGFSTDQLYSFSVEAGQAGYEGTRVQALLNQITDRIRAIPGVRMVSITNMLPLSGSANVRHVNNIPIPWDDKGPRTIVVMIGPRYFRTTGTPLTAGREFTQEDGAGTTKVTVLSESLARVLYGTSNPLGRRIWVGGEKSDVEIVGVVKDLKGISLRDQNSSYLYLPISQYPTSGNVGYMLKTSGPAVTLNVIRAAIKQVDSSLQVIEFGSVADRVSKSLFHDRALVFLSLCFAGLSSVLCAMGIFGLTSYSIAGRTKEIGLRIALGADSGSIYKLIMKEIALLSLIGCSAGLAGFIAISRIFAALLFQLKPVDPASLFWAILALGLTTFLAGYIPSRRAAMLDPTVALRWE